MREAGERNRLEGEFDAVMHALCARASDLDYYAAYFKRMLDQYGGLETARRLLREDEPQSGLLRLWELDALDISVEATVLRPQFRELFTGDELTTARQRLRDLDYEFTDD